MVEGKNIYDIQKWASIAHPSPRTQQLCLSGTSLNKHTALAVIREARQLQVQISKRPLMLTPKTYTQSPYRRVQIHVTKTQAVPLEPHQLT